MASRRVRIKGIANIPQRRKPTANENETEEQKDYENLTSEIVYTPNLDPSPDSHVKVIDRADEIKATVIQSKEVSEVATEDVEDAGKEVNVSRQILGPRLVSLVQHDENVSNVEKEPRQSVVPIADNKIIVKTEVENVTQARKVPINRRKFLKPVISINAFNRKPKEATDEIKIKPDKENVQESANINLNEVEISTNDANSTVLIQKIESVLGPNLDTAAVPSKESTKSGSDTECQQPSVSPTKILNRRIKAIPKLHQRRTSFSIGSASESEEDTRRSNVRIRNDSVCSANSGINETQSTIEAKSPTRRESGVTQRKCRKTEQTRKFAEARREFNMKFNDGKPDKQKLTMIDLIFYNPATSPMSYNKRKRKSTSSSDVSDTRSKADEEKIDDPQPASESDNEMPAPQIKVGPNGEIIVDEKSLVIENAETKRGRAALQMSEVVDGDDDTSYGIYKKIKRPKEWAKGETLRFYKALNTIGTDFTLMCELFPNRTRRELKMKFKKEERLNQVLINKALMQPCEFDITDLRKDLEMEAKRAEEKLKRAEEAKALRAALNEQRKTMKKGLKIKGIDMHPDNFSSEPIEKEKPVKRQKKSAYDVIKRGINSILSDSDESEDFVGAAPSPNPQDHTAEDPEDQANVSNILKPTRYGRVPKARLPDAVNCNTESKKRRRKRSVVHDGDDTQSELEPGSIMIVKSKTPSEKMVYKVYIVTNNKTKQEIDLAPNVLKNLSEIGAEHKEGDKKVDDIQAQSILTISAQECFDGGYLNSVNTPERDQANELASNTVKEVSGDSSNSTGRMEILSDSIIFPFDECLTPTGNQNVTVSHEDNKMIVITENNKRCVLTT